MRRAQGMSINTIIIAALALVVLVILIAVFTGRMGIFGRDLSGVQKGGTCGPSSDMKIVQGLDCASLGESWEVVYSNFESCQDGQDPISDGCYQAGYICCVNKG